MKKLLGLLFCSCLLLTGCGSDDKEKESTGTWKDALIEENTLIIGISPDYPPYENLTPDGEMVGFDIDMASELEKYLGVEIQYEQMSFDTIVDAVNLGKVDVGIAGFTYDEKKQVLFSDPYYKSAQVVLVNAASGIENLKDLEGKLIGAQTGTTSAEAANKIEGASVELNSDALFLAEALKNNQLDAVVFDIAVAKNYVKSEPDSFKMLDETLVEEENSIITAEGNTVLLEELNKAIKEFKNSEAYDELATKWFS